MTARDLFGAGTRLLGFYFFQAGLFDFVRVICKVAGIPLPSQYSRAEDLAAAIAMTAFGLFIMLGANLATRLLYGSENPN